MSENLIEDVSSASAAYTLNVVLPTLEHLSASEQFEKLKDCFESCLAAFIEFRREPTPSPN